MTEEQKRRINDHRPAVGLQWNENSPPPRVPFDRPEQWTILLTSGNHGLVGSYGHTFPHAEGDHERINVVDEAVVIKLRERIRELEAAGNTNKAVLTDEQIGKLGDEILSLHRKLAAEKLRADQGWERAAAKSKECIELRERLAAPAPADNPSTAEELKVLRHRVSELEAARMAYASEFPLTDDGEPDVGSIHANIRTLKAKLSDNPSTAGAANDLEALRKSTPFAYVATDLDGHADVGMTIDEAKRRAGNGCDTIIALHDISVEFVEFEGEPVAAPALNPSDVPPVVREAIEATFEQRPGYMAKIGAAVRAIGGAAAQSVEGGEA